MPNTKSAIKRLRTSAEAAGRNRILKSRITTYHRKLSDALVSGDAEGAKATYRQFCSALDKAVKTGVIKRNNADRRKSRAHAKVFKTA